ncbi:MAG TPA: universal stress protein [Nitrobacter sp.]|jgi:nucleotide-binding universal stress UspA family protein|nr:universal stress protein [Nitrobacter sp.]
MIKDVILYLERNKERDAVRDYAISIAETFDSHLTGVAFVDSGAVANYFMPGMPSDILEQILTESRKTGQDAVARFEVAAKRSLLSAEPRLIEGNELPPFHAFSKMARYFDLSVVMQSDEVTDNGLVIEQTLFGSGRPMIVVPYIQKDLLKLDRVVCCWDGSRAAARAVNDALPLLKKAASVELFVATTEKTEDEVPGTEIGNHLARYGMNVEVESLPAGDSNVADVILSHVADRSADLIVMGGYGHSRLREFVLGGATRGILSTMTVPVFMSH